MPSGVRSIHFSPPPTHARLNAYMGNSRHSGSAQTSPDGSPPHAAPVMAELVNQAAAMSLSVHQQRGGFRSGGSGGGDDIGSFGLPGAGYGGAGYGGAVGSGAVGNGGGFGGGGFGATAFSTAFGGQLNSHSLDFSASSPSRSNDSSFDSRSDWERHLGSRAFNGGSRPASAAGSAASSFGSVTSSHNGSVFEGAGGGAGSGRHHSGGGYGNGYAVQPSGGGYGNAAYALPSPQQTPAAPPQLPANTASPFLQYNFQQVRRFEAVAAQPTLTPQPQRDS